MEFGLGCVKCGEQIDRTDQFCSRCGSRVLQEDSSLSVYDENFFDKIEDMTTPSADDVVEVLTREFHPSSVVDFGCGSGVYLKKLQNHGLEVFGIDGASVAEKRSKGIPFQIHDLNTPLILDEQFDLSLCFETAEHLRPEGAVHLVKSLTLSSDTIAFSAAPPGQGGDCHFNEQPLPYWIELFLNEGFELDPLASARLRAQLEPTDVPFWLVENLAVFKKQKIKTFDPCKSREMIESLSGWLTCGEASLLGSIVRNLANETPQPLVVVELGSWYGKATVALALALKSLGKGCLHSYDHHRGDPDLAEYLEAPWSEIFSRPRFEATIQFAGVQDIVQSEVVDPLVAQSRWTGGKVNFLWIDGDHRPEIVKKTFDSWVRHVCPGGIVAFHDIHLHGPIAVVDGAFENGILKERFQVDSIVMGRVVGETPGPGGSLEIPPTTHIAEKSVRKVSCIIVTRNEGEYVRKTVEDFLAKTRFPNFELLIIDDASDDGSCDFLTRQPYTDDSRIRFICSDSQRGYLEWRIRASELADGEIFQFLDAHHAFSTNWLTNLYNSLKTRNFDALICPVVTNLNSETWDASNAVGYGWHVDRDLKKIWPGGWHELRDDCRVPSLVGHALIVSRDVHEKVGGFLPYFEGHGGEDIEYCLRAARYGYRCHVEPTSQIAHLFKSGFMNPVSWTDILLNDLITVFVNFGDDLWQERLAEYAEKPELPGAMAKFENIRSDLERIRDRLEDHAKVSPTELRNWLGQIREPAV